MTEIQLISDGDGLAIIGERVADSEGEEQGEDAGADVGRGAAVEGELPATACRTNKPAVTTTMSGWHRLVAANS